MSLGKTLRNEGNPWHKFGTYDSCWGGDKSSSRVVCLCYTANGSGRYLALSSDVPVRREADTASGGAGTATRSLRGLPSLPHSSDGCVRQDSFDGGSNHEFGPDDTASSRTLSGRTNSQTELCQRLSGVSRSNGSHSGLRNGAYASRGSANGRKEFSTINRSV